MVVAATSRRLWAASEISASEPVANPAAPLATVMRALATIDQRAGRSLRRLAWGVGDRSVIGSAAPLGEIACRFLAQYPTRRHLVGTVELPPAHLTRTPDAP